MTELSPVSGYSKALFAAGGEVGKLILQNDWQDSPIGPPDSWPSALVDAVSLLLPARAEIVLFWGPEHVALYNAAYAATIGEKHPRSFGRPAREGWSDMWDDFEPLLRHVMVTGETYSASDRPFYIERFGHGEEVNFDVSFSPVRLADTSVGGVLCIVSETTARVRAARQVAQDRARLSEMFDQAPGFMAVLRQPGHVFELVNASYQQLIGNRDIIGKPLHLAMPEVSEQGFLTLLDLVVATGVPYRGQNVHVQLARTRDGPTEDRVLDFVYQPITDSENRVTAVFVEGVDVTERQHHADRLSESETRFRMLADSLPALVWINDAEGRLLFANDAFNALLGVSPAEMLADGWRRVVHESDVSAFSEFGRRRLSEPRGFSRDVPLRTADGNVRWFHVEGRPRILSDRFEGYVGCGVDVTESHLIGEDLERRVAARTAELTEQIAERERVEATLAQMQRLEAIGQLTSGLAHDFNNLLTVVLGNIPLIERAISQAGLDAKTLQRLEHVRTASERGAKLTGQLLAFSRRQRLEAKAVSLTDIVAGMRDLLHSTLGGRMAIEITDGQDLWPALADPTQIELIILNLAINARDAMQGSGTLTVSTGNITLKQPLRPEEPAAGDYVRVAVTDTGSGMSGETRNRAFEPFFTTKEIGKGSGLGLAQVYGIAMQSGGGVRIDSEPGRGTTVSVFLPRAREAEAAMPSEVHGEEASGSVAGRRILVLDDDDAVRRVTADQLREAGCHVIEAADGASALNTLDSVPGIAAVFADFAMPGMNGADFARRAHLKRPSLPIVFVTGYADLAALAHVPEENVIQKPFANGAIVNRLRLMLATQRTEA